MTKTNPFACNHALVPEVVPTQIGWVITIVMTVTIILNAILMVEIAVHLMQMQIGINIVKHVTDSGTIVFTSKIVFSINEQLTIVFRAVDNCLQTSGQLSS